jgi:hypothetical protein
LLLGDEIGFRLNSNPETFLAMLMRPRWARVFLVMANPRKPKIASTQLFLPGELDLDFGHFPELPLLNSFTT